MFSQKMLKVISLSWGEKKNLTVNESETYASIWFLSVVGKDQNQSSNPGRVGELE